MRSTFFFLEVKFFFPFFISWRLTTLQYCSVFCHTLTWISHGFTCIPHPDPPSHLPLHPIPLGLPSAPGLSTCLMHPAWAGDLLEVKLHFINISHHAHSENWFLILSFSCLIWSYITTKTLAKDLGTICMSRENRAPAGIQRFHL